MSPRAIAVDLLDGIVEWNGECAPITNYFVLEGSAGKLDLTRVCSVVAGPYQSGQWLSTETTREEREQAKRLH